MLAHVRELIEPSGVAYVSTPNVLTLAPKGEERSGNPWHVREYKPGEYRELCERHFGQVDLLGLFHARKLRAHQVAIEHLAWDRVHKRLLPRSRSMTASRRRSPSATSRSGVSGWTAAWTCWPS